MRFARSWMVLAAFLAGAAQAQEFDTNAQASREIERLGKDLDSARAQVRDGVPAATACTAVLGRARGLEAFRNDDLTRLGAQARQECEVTLPLKEIQQRLAAIDPTQEAASAGAGCRRVETTLGTLDTTRIRAAEQWLELEGQLQTVCPGVAGKLMSKVQTTTSNASSVPAADTDSGGR